MTDVLHPQVASLAEAYARELSRCIPSRALDARIEHLVADSRHLSFRAAGPDGARATRRRAPATYRAVRWVAAACVGTLAVAAGVIIGVRVERAGMPALAAAAREPTWPPTDFSMWPTDSVALKIPAEVSSHGTLVAVNGKAHSAGARYWVDVVVSNDGTVRIENVVPAGEQQHGIDIRNP
jgi:hypothetical protein